MIFLLVVKYRSKSQNIKIITLIKTILYHVILLAQMNYRFYNVIENHRTAHIFIHQGTLPVT